MVRSDLAEQRCDFDRTHRLCNQDVVHGERTLYQHILGACRAGYVNGNYEQRFITFLFCL
jgi:hypothetical protein